MLIQINGFQNSRLIMNINEALNMQATSSKMIGEYIKTINNQNIEQHHVFPILIDTGTKVAANKITFYIEK